MHALGAHLYRRQFCEPVFAVEIQSPPSIDVVNDWLFFPLLGVGKLYHAHITPSAVEAV